MDFGRTTRAIISRARPAGWLAGLLLLMAAPAWALDLKFSVPGPDVASPGTAASTLRLFDQDQGAAAATSPAPFSVNVNQLNTSQRGTGASEFTINWRPRPGLAMVSLLTGGLNLKAGQTLPQAQFHQLHLEQGKLKLTATFLDVDAQFQGLQQIAQNRSDGVDLSRLNGALGIKTTEFEASFGSLARSFYNKTTNLRPGNGEYGLTRTRFQNSLNLQLGGKTRLSLAYNQLTESRLQGQSRRQDEQTIGIEQKFGKESLLSLTQSFVSQNANGVSGGYSLTAARFQLKPIASGLNRLSLVADLSRKRAKDGQWQNSSDFNLNYNLGQSLTLNLKHLITASSSSRRRAVTELNLTSELGGQIKLVGLVKRSGPNSAGGPADNISVLRLQGPDQSHLKWNLEYLRNDPSQLINGRPTTILGLKAHLDQGPAVDKWALSADNLGLFQDMARWGLRPVPGWANPSPNSGLDLLYRRLTSLDTPKTATGQLFYQRMIGRDLHLQAGIQQRPVITQNGQPLALPFSSRMLQVARRFSPRLQLMGRMVDQVNTDTRERSTGTMLALRHSSSQHEQVELAMLSQTTSASAAPGPAATLGVRFARDWNRHRQNVELKRTLEVGLLRSNGQAPTAAGGAFLRFQFAERPLPEWARKIGRASLFEDAQKWGFRPLPDWHRLMDASGLEVALRTQASAGPGQPALSQRTLRYQRVIGGFHLQFAYEQNPDVIQNNTGVALPVTRSLFQLAARVSSRMALFGRFTDQRDRQANRRTASALFGLGGQLTRHERLEAVCWLDRTLQAGRQDQNIGLGLEYAKEINQDNYLIFKGSFQPLAPNLPDQSGLRFDLGFRKYL